jgi:hypothetical protein
MDGYGPEVHRVGGRRPSFHSVSSECNFVSARRPLRESALRWSIRVVTPIGSTIAVGLRGGSGPAQWPFREEKDAALDFLPIGHRLSCQISDADMDRFRKLLPTRYELSFEADLRRGRVYMWEDGRFHGAVIDGVPELENMRPAIALTFFGDAQAVGQTAELVDCPPESDRGLMSQCPADEADPTCLFRPPFIRLTPNRAHSEMNQRPFCMRNGDVRSLSDAEILARQPKNASINPKNSGAMASVELGRFAAVQSQRPISTAANSWGNCKKRVSIILAQRAQ